MADRFAWPAPAPSEPTTPTENPQRGFEDPSRFNLWRLGSCSIRRQQVAADAPATKMSWGTASNFPITKNSEALIYGRQIRLTGAFHLRVGNADQRFPEDFWKFEETGRSNLWRPVSCAVRRQWVRPTSKLSWGTASSFPITKNLEALIYGRQIRLAGASTASKLSLA